MKNDETPEDYFKNLDIAVRRLERETGNAYQSFLKFCWLQGGERSAEVVARELGFPIVTVRAWLTQNDWLDRASVVDGLKFTRDFKMREAATEEDNIEFARKNRQLKQSGLAASEKMIAVAQKLLLSAELVDDVIETGFVVTQDGRRVPTSTTIKMKAKISDIPRLVDTAIKTARLVQDLPTDIIEDRIGLGTDISKLTIEQIMDLRETNQDFLRKKGVLNTIDQSSETVQ